MILFYISHNHVCRFVITIFLMGIVTTRMVSCENLDASNQMPPSVFTQDDCQSNNFEMKEVPFFTQPGQLNLVISRPSGHMLNIRCAATGIPEPNITWTKDSRGIDRLSEVKIRKWTLVLKNLSSDDSGHYTCKLCNIHGCIKHTTKLLVEGGNLSSINERYINWLLAVLAASICIGVWIFIKFFTTKNKSGHIVKLRHKSSKRKAKKSKNEVDSRMRLFIDKSSDTGFDEISGNLLAPILWIEGLDPSQDEFHIDAIEIIFPLDENWEFPRDQLTLSITLGNGNFGQIFKAEARGFSGKQSQTTVAVEKLKDPQTGFRVICFVREIEIMKIIGQHRNIVNLLGCCTQNGPLYAIFEYAPFGDLQTYLVKYKNTLFEKDLISFAKQVACGMEYLTSMRCIHRDLAARNVLVFHDLVVKIADFGLAIDLRDEEYFNGSDREPTPFRWRAPETLPENIHQLNCDIWSYGVLIWEIMTFGIEPHLRCDNKDELYDYLLSGERMPKPANCPPIIYELLQKCWQWNPCDRPSFNEICKIFDDILKNDSILRTIKQ